MSANMPDTGDHVWEPHGPDSKVSKLAMRDEQEKRDRQYEVMPELNYKPAITYLKKVNTREVQGLHGGNKSSEHNGDESHS